MIEKVIKKIKQSEKYRWFDILEVSSESTHISFRNNRIHSILEKQNHGFGVRINLNGKTGFSYTNDAEGIEGAVTRAVDLSGYGEEESYSLPGKSVSGFDPYDDDINKFNPDNEIVMCESVLKKILDKFPGANIDMGVSRSTGSVKIVNSSGLDVSYKNSYYSNSLSVTLIHDDGIKLDIWDSRSGLKPGDFGDIADKMNDKLETATKIRKTNSGKMNIILTPKAASSMLRLVTGGLNARSVWKGISPFGDKSGEKLFSGKFSLADSPGIKDSPFSYPFDDEGVDACEKQLIDKGILKGFITDLRHAERLGIEPGGNGSRGYSTLPVPSFSNIVIGGGSRSISSIMKDINRGILVDQFIGLGQSNTLTGDFSTNLDLAYLIENGEITGRVKDCMISGNLFEKLSGEIEMSSETERRGSAVVPYVLLPDINYTS